MAGAAKVLRLLGLLGSSAGFSASLAASPAAASGSPPSEEVQRVEVVAQELHDQRAVAVGLLGERVELGDGVVEGLLGEVAGAVGRVQDLVVEDREVQGEAETDRVGRGELGLGDVGGILGLASQYRRMSATIIVEIVHTL